MKNNIFNILKKELRETFRDKKSLSMMLVIPFMIPLIVIGMSALFNSEQDKPVTDYNKIGFAYELSDIEENILKELEIDSIFKSVEDLEKMYDNEEVDIYVTKENGKFIMNGKDNEKTAYASSLVQSYLLLYEEYLQNEYLIKNNINPNEVLNIIDYEIKYKDEENFFSNNIKIYAFLFIIMAITVSATYPATDATAGEKERGTLETLLTFPIKSKDIIIGKFLSVSLSSVITGLLSLILAIISLNISSNMFKIYEGINMNLSFEATIFAIIVIITYSLLISGLSIAIASTSKTFKEAQSALTPLTFISMFPGMIAFLIDIKSTFILSMVPFLNYILLFKDIVSGKLNYINILLMVISTILIIAIVLYIIIKEYKSEKVLFTK